MSESIIDAAGANYTRIPVRTRLILKGTDLRKAVEDGLAEAAETPGPEDILFLSEKAVGASQGRYFLLDEGEIHPRRLARFLSSHVTKTPAGIGLGMPETMEAALRECGVARILFAALVGAAGKLLGRKGDFYRVAGAKARSIDGPTAGTLPPFNRAVSLSPLDPEGVSKALSEAFGCGVAVVDVNDLGGNILGRWPRSIDRDLLVRILRDNPLGQGDQRTPVGIIRRTIQDPK
jgi:F420-0:gamma-glutamyl ligase